MPARSGGRKWKDGRLLLPTPANPCQPLPTLANSSPGRKGCDTLRLCESVGVTDTAATKNSGGGRKLTVISGSPVARLPNRPWSVICHPVSGRLFTLVLPSVSCGGPHYGGLNAIIPTNRMTEPLGWAAQATTASFTTTSTHLTSIHCYGDNNQPSAWLSRLAGLGCCRLVLVGQAGLTGWALTSPRDSLHQPGGQRRLQT